MVFELHEGTGLQSPGTFKNLYISNIPDNLDHLSHQSLVSKLDKANLILRYRSFGTHKYKVGNNTMNFSLCLIHVSILIFKFFRKFETLSELIHDFHEDFSSRLGTHLTPSLNDHQLKHETQNFLHGEILVNHGLFDVIPKK